MRKQRLTEREKRQIRERVQREFPGSKVLQNLHFYRYVKEIQWRTMSREEIVEDIKRGAREIKKAMKKDMPVLG
jgi:hypothetical protein